MPTFTVRRAALEDAADICALDRDGLGYDYPPEKTHEKLRAALADPAQAVLVAVQDGQTAGYAHAGAHAFYERCGYTFCKMQKNYKRMF